MKLYNTKTRSVDNFVPLYQSKVTFYSCGLTVYDYAHIGHARKYINDDFLKRTLTFLGYEVNHVMNITDVGHLESDEDQGQDKLEKGAKKHGKTPEEVAEFFTDYFLKANDAVNILRPNTLVKATDHIQEMIDLITILEEKGATYETNEAVYFDTSTYNKYGSLSGQNLKDKVSMRKDVYVDPKKKNQTDFALWFKCVGQHANHTMRWDSPWGEGFPGWHIECSAMSMKYLGETIDIHSGGIDHIPVHHENEIAQSEVATDKEFVRHWFHSEFLKVNGTKMGKSLGNMYTIDDLREKGIDPLALRFLFLQAHYRQELNFTWESLAGAETALNKLRAAVIQLRKQSNRQQLSKEKLQTVQDMAQRFTDSMQNDLQIPQALAIVWEVVKSNIPSPDKLELIYSFDQVLGLGLAEYEDQDVDEIPVEIKELADKREVARQKKDFAASDALRDEMKEHGYEIIDLDDGYRLKKA